MRNANVLEVAERRLVRLGLDIHDGPVQDTASLVTDVSLVRERLAALAPSAAFALADIEDRLRRLHEELRDLAVSLESRALAESDLVEVLERETAEFRRRCAIELELSVEGDFAELTASQRTATARIVQEAMSNIREHSRARHARVHVEAGEDAITIEVWDDGVGFRHSGRGRNRGRLGIVGMHERTRLLHGTLDVRSRPGGPTLVRARLPRWRPSPAGTTVAA
jgi:two-component system, NarL family, sensor histidine kinase DegS